MQYRYTHSFNSSFLLKCPFKWGSAYFSAAIEYVRFFFIFLSVDSISFYAGKIYAKESNFSLFQVEIDVMTLLFLVINDVLFHYELRCINH